MANKHTNRCSVSLVIRGLQIKTQGTEQGYCPAQPLGCTWICALSPFAHHPSLWAWGFPGTPLSTRPPSQQLLGQSCRIPRPFLHISGQLWFLPTPKSLSNVHISLHFLIFSFQREFRRQERQLCVQADILKRTPYIFQGINGVDAKAKKRKKEH